MGSTNGYFSGEESPTLVDELRKELENLSPLSPDCCIYRVPNRLRRGSEKTYTPQIVSIGPIHHGKEGLEPMEEHKKRYLQSFLRHTRVSLGAYVAKVKEREIDIRRSYADSIEFEIEKLVKIVLVDAAFLIELFLRFVDLKYRDVDRIYEKPLLMRHIVPDLQLLENQLPFFIFDDLLKIATNAGFIVHPQHNSMAELSHIFFKAQLLVSEKVEMSKICSPEVLHFVDLLWKLYQTKELTGGMLKTITVPTITELHQAGVRFKKGEPTNMFNITFKDGILTIPCLKLLDRSEILFRNLIAFEHCHCLKKNYLTDYFVLMERLVEGPGDLKLLVKYGIIEHSMGDNDESSSMIKELVDGVMVDFRNFHFAAVCEEMNVYCGKSWHKWKANFKQKYLNTPWAGISAIAASVLLLMTFIQTICSLFSLHK